MIVLSIIPAPGGCTATNLFYLPPLFRPVIELLTPVAVIPAFRTARACQGRGQGSKCVRPDQGNDVFIRRMGVDSRMKLIRT